ncbi:MAG: alpha/beta fold hydrolase [Mycobacteriales bacterium]
MPATTHYLSRPGGRIAYDVSGCGPLVVCVPGMGDLRSSYRLLAPRLVDAGYRVAAMDLRGHGESDASFDGYDNAASSGDVVALIDELGGPATIVGNSMGGAAAAYTAAEHPGRVSGLVLLGAFLREPPTSMWTKLMLRALLLRPWGRAAWGRYYASLFKDNPPADLPERRAAANASLSRPAHWKAFVATTRTSHQPVCERLARVGCGGVVVMGTKDPDFADPAAEAVWGAEQIRGETHLVAGAGHYPQVEQPDEVARVTIAYLRRGDRA